MKKTLSRVKKSLTESIKETKGLHLRQEADRARDEMRWNEAADKYAGYLEKNPEDKGIWIQLGHMLKESRHYRGALAAYENAARLGEDSADLHLQLGHLAKLMGDRRKMVASYKSAMIMDPLSKDADKELYGCSPKGINDWLVIDQIAAPASPHQYWVPQEPGIRPPALSSTVREDALRAAVNTIKIQSYFKNAVEDIRDKRVVDDYLRFKVGVFNSTYSSLMDVFRLVNSMHGSKPDGVVTNISLLFLGVVSSINANDLDVEYPVKLLNAYGSFRKDVTNRFDFNIEAAGSVSGNVKISVLMPVYKGPIIYVERAILSVLLQSYDNIELCIVDDASQDPALTALLRFYESLDSRVKVSIHAGNKGISEASNTAFSMATGTHIALLDHDDMLTFDALEAMALAIQDNPGVTLVYSDECKIDERNIADEIFIKPDWSPSLLLSTMYTGHLSVYTRSAILKAGGFRSQFDFSQDYDLVLRVSEMNPKVVHISTCLYGWRMINGSAAVGGKPMARLGNVKALQSALDRRGFKGRAYGLPASNRAALLKPSAAAKVSIIIPSDSPYLIDSAVSSIILNTIFDNYEVIVVTNSACAKKREGGADYHRVHFVKYDYLYNFSAKCNAGAGIATGDILIFFNDDVRVTDQHWLDAIVDLFEFPDVGAVSPKLLYENGAIQHAGMVTGVRGLVGTAFHTFPDLTNAHFNFAQSTREVSVLSGALLAVRTAVYKKIDGFDAINTPISHSDVDICFRIREAGFRCIYTPHTKLTHIGHLSISQYHDDFAKIESKDAADIYMLRKWGGYLARDPYFPEGMRDIVFIDSQEPFHFYANSERPGFGGKSILILSHDLTGSGAPKIVFDLSKSLMELGHYVLVVSPSDGVFRERLQKLGVDVIIDSLCMDAHESFLRLAKNFDAVICNTITTWKVPGALKNLTNVFLYAHESELIRDFCRDIHGFKESFNDAARVIAAGPLTARIIKEEVGVDALILTGASERLDCSNIPRGDEVVVSIAGTYEPRKGQDIAIDAFKMLPDEIKARVKLRLAGRTNDKDFRVSIEHRASNDENIEFLDELDYDDVINYLSSSDIVLIPSRDEAMSLVGVEGLALGKILICSKRVGISDYILDGVSGYVSDYLSPQDICETLVRAILDSSNWPVIGDAGKRVYEENFSPEIFKENVRSFVENLI